MNDIFDEVERELKEPEDEPISKVYPLGRRIFTEGDYVEVGAHRIRESRKTGEITQETIYATGTVSHARYDWTEHAWDYTIRYDESNVPLPCSFWRDGEMILLRPVKEAA